MTPFNEVEKFFAEEWLKVWLAEKIRTKSIKSADFIADEAIKRVKERFKIKLN